MQLASAPSSIVPGLRRLEGSRPTFVLLSGGRLVDVVFGCNAPAVIRAITDEVERWEATSGGRPGSSPGYQRLDTVGLSGAGRNGLRRASNSDAPCP